MLFTSLFYSGAFCEVPFKQEFVITLEMLNKLYFLLFTIVGNGLFRICNEPFTSFKDCKILNT